MTNKYWRKDAQSEDGHEPPIPAGQASHRALTGQKASGAGNGYGRRPVGCSPSATGVQTALPRDGCAGDLTDAGRRREVNSGFAVLPGRTWDPRLTHIYGVGERQQRGPIQPRRPPGTITSASSQRHQPPQVRLIPLAATTSGTHPLIFHAKYQNYQWFHTGSTANPVPRRPPPTLNDIDGSLLW